MYFKNISAKTNSKVRAENAIDIYGIKISDRLSRFFRKKKIFSFLGNRKRKWCNYPLTFCYVRRKKIEYNFIKSMLRTMS